MALCELDNVDKIYGSGELAVYALKAVTTTVTEGEFTVFSGPSGSGKTTLLNMVGCLDVPSSGTVKIAGTDVGRLSQVELAHLRADKIGFIFQSFNLIPVLSAVENVELALQLAGQVEGRRDKASGILDKVGLGSLLHRRPNELSGGQQQRVAIARALVKHPSLIIADEPTANLDSKSGGAVLDLMREMNEESGVTFLFSTHDPAVMERAKRVVTLVDGVIADQGR
ncbi:MAG: ABC transporter ATP-binding protein [Deltaproteobacteria bacterium]|nr:MAG: ABC transporter ATP-binding protein [Deltaproteobacteria bacterium]